MWGKDAALSQVSASTLPVSLGPKQGAPAQALMLHKLVWTEVGFLYREHPSFRTQQLTHLLLRRRTYFQPGTVTILRCSMCCQLCLPQTWGPGSLMGNALAVGSTLPMGRNVQAGKQQAYNLDCVLYTHTAGQAELGLWLWGTWVRVTRLDCAKGFWMCQPQESQQATLDHLKLLSLSAMHHVPRSRGSMPRSHLWHLIIIVNSAGSQEDFNSRLKPRVSTHPRGGVL